MELVTSSQKIRKNIIKKIIFTMLSLVVVVISVTIICLLNSEKIGDWYLDVKKNPVKSTYWYETNYNRTKNDDVLLKIATSLKLSKDYTRQKVYYPLIFSSKNLNENQRQNYIEQYIEAYFYTDDFSGFKAAYKKYSTDLTNNSSVVIPLQLVIDDQTIIASDLKWALDFSNELLETNDNLLIKATLYSQQASIYQRLGNNSQASVLNQKSIQIKDQLLK